ncbi:MAG: hypothetical protein U5L96_10980 [Owenweeksia sp.]|nr:hypothetical protein [Owenweeksia sp.]
MSVWLSVDPLAHNAPQYSAYAFSFNNPVMFYDPDGRWPYKITFRSFHPGKSFGGGTLFSLFRDFHGDYRGFSLSDNVTSRIIHGVTADPETGGLSYSGRGRGGTYADPSYHPIYGREKGKPDGYIGRKRLGTNSISFLTGYQGPNPLIPSPNINVDANLTITQDGDVLIIKGKGDDFPNTEAFIEDPSGQRLFIGQDERASGQDDNPTILFGPSTEEIMNIDIRVKINPNNGNFIELLLST